MTLQVSTLRIVGALIALPIVGFGLYTRFARVFRFQKGELERGTGWAKVRVALAVLAFALLVVIGLLAAFGVRVQTVYTLLLLEAAVVLLYLGVTVAAGARSGGHHNSQQ